jgi:hypothetical protein
MPTSYVSTIVEVADILIAKLKENAGELGLQFVGAYDEKRLPQYPCVVVVPGPKTKALPGVSFFSIDFLVDIYVYHGDMTIPHAMRNREDLLLVDKIEALLESDYTLGNKVVFGFIAENAPGRFHGGSQNQDIIAGTLMRWVGTSRRLMRG